MSSSSNRNSDSTKGGVGFCGLLAIAFIVLKLIGVITWSWVWVLSPIWIPFCIRATYFCANLRHIINNKGENHVYNT